MYSMSGTENVLCIEKESNGQSLSQLNVPDTYFNISTLLMETGTSLPLLIGLWMITKRPLASQEIPRCRQTCRLACSNQREI